MFDITEHVCRSCGGDGEIDTIEWVQCAACQGNGLVLDASCDACDGRGQYQIGAKTPCPECVAEPDE